MFSENEAVKIIYVVDSVEHFFRGRIAAIHKNEIILKPYGKRDTSLARVALNDITEIKKINRTGRVITGAILGAAILGGVIKMLGNVGPHQVTEPSLFGSGTYQVQAAGNGGTDIGALIIIGGAIPYMIASMKGENLKKSKGYTFMIIKK